MNTELDTNLYLGFFENELTNNLLSFWLPRCVDPEHGGYLNCFTNDGSTLVSTDKYTWSQGRFLWLFSRLAMMDSNTFTARQKAHFLELAKNGQDFLHRHVLVAPGDYRCVFLMHADGSPKGMDGQEGYDLSILADCFVVMGFAAYARAAGDIESWQFAKALGQSVWDRYHSGNHRLLPYPHSDKFRSHTKPMILTNVCCELYYGAVQFDPAYAQQLKDYIDWCSREVFEVFTDKNHLLHEFVRADGSFAENIFGQHINPGHTIEDMWFQLEASKILETHRYDDLICDIVRKTVSLGWDAQYGGLCHFMFCDGEHTRYTPGDAANEPQLPLVLGDWDSKLWWVHSEAMYTTLLLYDRTEDAAFFHLFRKIFDYTYRTFPNPDPEIREWIQIRTRQGAPLKKVVALPVKDPYHIIRNILLIIELLEARRKRGL